LHRSKSVRWSYQFDAEQGGPKTVMGKLFKEGAKGKEKNLGGPI